MRQGVTLVLDLPARNRRCGSVLYIPFLFWMSIQDIVISVFVWQKVTVLMFSTQAHVFFFYI